MAGEALTNKFVFGTATVMCGPLGEGLNLNPTDHSLGLVKNFNMERQANYVELGQGVRNDIVESVQNEETLTVSTEVYEFSSKNLAYAAGLDGASITAAGQMWEVASASGTTVETDADASAEISAGDWVVIQEDTSDVVHVAKVDSIATTTITLTTGTAIPAGVTFTTAARIGKANRIKSRDSLYQPYYSVKVVGFYPRDARPLTIVFPKVKFTRGLTVGFNRDDFSNMPVEFSPYVLLPGDAGYTDHGYAKYLMFTG